MRIGARVLRAGAAGAAARGGRGVAVAGAVVAGFAAAVAVGVLVAGAAAGSGGGAFGSAALLASSAPHAAPEAVIITPLAVPPQALDVEVDVRAMEASAPVRLVIPSIGVDTSLMELGIAGDGTLEVPPDGSNAGWFTGAPTPGEMGPSVIAGHVDWLGPGVFHDLHLVSVGDPIEVQRADGSTAVFVVTAVGQYAKDAFPTQDVYGDVSFAALRVITCGGVWNDATGHYDDNIVVFAELQPAS